MSEPSTDASSPGITITNEQLQKGVTFENGKVIEMPSWKKSLYEIMEGPSSGSNEGILQQLESSEKIIQDALDSEDMGQAVKAFDFFCNNYEPHVDPFENNEKVSDELIPQERIRSFKANFVSKNIDRLDEIIEAKPHTAAIILRDASMFFRPEYMDHPSSIMDFFIKHYEEGKGYWTNNDEFFDFVFTLGSEDQRRWAFDRVVDELERDESKAFKRPRNEILSYLSPVLRQAYERAIDGKEIEDSVFGDVIDLFDKQFEKYGFVVETEDLLGLWIGSKSEDISMEIVQDNLQAMETLEKLRPGAVKTLWDEYGIADFGRYPINLLAWQYDNRENQDVPYGVMIYPQADHNGAFYQQKESMNVLFAELQELGFGLRVFEAGSSTEVLRALAKSHERFGETNKISFAILGGHGSEKSITFGMGQKGYINLQEVIERKSSTLERNLSKVKEPFVHEPTIILNSCSTGAENGFGHDLSVFFGAKVIGPDKDTPIGEMHVEKGENGKLDFDVDYPAATKKAYLGGASINKSP